MKHQQECFVADVSLFKPLHSFGFLIQNHELLKLYRFSPLSRLGLIHLSI